jgi:hypothetical protein
MVRQQVLNNHLRILTFRLLPGLARFLNLHFLPSAGELT